MLKHPYHLLIALLAVLLAASCADDLATQDDTPAPGEGEGIVRLAVPGTRSIPTTDETGEADATDMERAVRDLWFLAYPVTDGQGEPVVCRLNTDELEHEYKTFSIRMPFGTYHIYVVANVDGLSPATKESELKSIILSYKNGDRLALPDPKDGLPMSYQRPTPFTVDAQGGTLQADLVYCCVKVRYTLLFDNSTDGASHSAFGDNYLRVTSVGGRNVATRVSLLPTGQPVEDQERMDTDDNAFDGRYADGAYTEAEHETLSFTSDEPQANGTWAYRGTLYLPEHYVASDKQDDQTSLRIAATLYTADGTPATGLEYTIELGEDLANDDDDPTRQLPRGRFYDITGRITTLGDQIETTVAVQDWTPVEVNTELESPYHLWVQETAIDELVAGTPVTIPCRTDAPKLESYSSTTEIKSDDGVVVFNGSLFLVTFNQVNGEYTSFTVQLNPEIPPGNYDTQIQEEYRHIFIRIPDPETGEYLLSKRIDIKNLITEPYFVVTPKQYTLYISEIGNMAFYNAVFTYETNMQEVAVKCGATDVTTTKISWVENEHVTITDNGLNDGTGTVTVCIDQPYQPSFYPRTQTVVLDYTASYQPTSDESDPISITDQTRVTIIPNAQTYRLHFRPVDDSWENPHIYVYEPLYAPDGKEVLREWYNEAIRANEQENALLYGFTGGVTFKGWSSQGGTEQWPNNSTLTLSGNRWLASNVGAGTWNPLNTDNNAYQLGNVYDYSIDYCPSFREDCCATFNAQDKNHNIKWPGVKMKVDTENPGWFYFDLPSLASPGTTLIMFADTHAGRNEPQYRYPAHLVPGVPLYDYADKDGWFLYDYNKGDDNEFVDDKPEVITYTYRIYVNDTNRGTRIHVWEVDGQSFTTWDDPSGDLKTDTEGKRYFEFTLRSPEDKRIGYKFMKDSGDSFIEVSQWQPVTGKDYDYEYTIY